MERQNRPPTLQISTQSPIYLSALSYNRTPPTNRLPSWAISRRRTLTRTCPLLTSSAGVMFIALLIITGTLTWLVAPNRTAITPLSQLSDSPPVRNSVLDRAKSIHNPPLIAQSEEDMDIANSTLNFQRIFAINLPSRLDRKDLLTLMATYSNLSITIVPGVQSVSENSLPPPQTPGSRRTEEYAVWRAHANVWRRIIEDGITTALIIEDDNDWDINLRQQIPRIMNALKEIRRKERRNEDEAVVRGDSGLESWDLIYLGSCFEEATLADSKGRKTVVSIPSDQENVASHNYNWVMFLVGNVNRVG
jgi:hypothetical protein